MLSMAISLTDISKIYQSKLLLLTIGESFKLILSEALFAQGLYAAPTEDKIKL